VNFRERNFIFIASKKNLMSWADYTNDSLTLNETELNSESKNKPGKYIPPALRGKSVEPERDSSRKENTSRDFPRTSYPKSPFTSKKSEYEQRTPGFSREDRHIAHEREDVKVSKKEETEKCELISILLNLSQLFLATSVNQSLLKISVHLRGENFPILHSKNADLITMMNPIPSIQNRAQLLFKKLTLKKYSHFLELNFTNFSTTKSPLKQVEKIVLRQLRVGLTVI
jgi:hypothetical protein